MTGDPILTLSEARDPLADAVIRRGLAAYNTARFRPSDTTTLDVLVRDDSSGEVLGGLLGHTSYRLLFLDVFYLPEELREAGLGSRIIAMAEAEARLHRRLCQHGHPSGTRFLRAPRLPPLWQDRLPARRRHPGFLQQSVRLKPEFFVVFMQPAGSNYLKRAVFGFAAGSIWASWSVLAQPAVTPRAGTSATLPKAAHHISRVPKPWRS